MNQEKFIHALASPEGLHDLSVEELQMVVQTFPYFSSAHLLLVKKMQVSNHLHFTPALKRAAVAINDRKKLYTYLYQTSVQEVIKAHMMPSEGNPEVAVEKGTETPSHTEVDTNEFTDVTFATPVDLKSLGESAKEIDELEKQIIGHTIEHMLTQEISTKLPEKTSEESKLESTKDTQKFSEWLAILDHKRLTSQRQPKDDALSEANIIDSFLNKDINIISPTVADPDFSPSNLARLSVVEDNEFVTETLANIYASQGNFEKAIATFTKLIAKYPEKKTYFAGRIRKIEQELKNK